MYVRVVVWFSCGAASAVAAKLAIERYGRESVRIVNNPIKEEDEDNQRFLRDVQAWLGHSIEFALHPKYPTQSCEEIWEARNYMAGPQGAPCTMLLKKEARQLWEAENQFDYLILGFTADERKRAERFQLTERANLVPILVEEGLTKQDCFDLLLSEGLRLPRVYTLGYPNANCIGCVKASSPTYWNHVRKMHPKVFRARAEQSRRIGARLVRVAGKRIFLDELDVNAKGRPLRTFTVECGIFCEEQEEV